MIGDRYTLHIVPNNTNDIKTFTVKKVSVITAAAALSCLLIITLVVGIYVLTLHQQNNHLAMRLDRQISRNLMLKNDLVAKSESLYYIDDKVEALKEISSRLAMTIGLSAKVYEYANPGRGGFDIKRADTDNLYQLLFNQNESQYLKMLKQEVDNLDTSFTFIEDIYQKNHLLLSALPTLMPADGYISSAFGYRRSPFTGKREFHRGIDISAPVGTPVYAPANGKVVFTGRKAGFGNMVIIEHELGFCTKYAHLDKYNCKKWQTIKRGDILAYVGNTSRSTGPHLHYEILFEGVNVNPRRYFFDSDF